MKPVYVDLHIHTSENPEKLDANYDLEILSQKLMKESEGAPFLISLTDHNTVNKAVYLRAKGLFQNLLLGVELHVLNDQSKRPYHCHFYFKAQIDEQVIDQINGSLDRLYPSKIITDQTADIPRLERVMDEFDSLEFLVLPHGGQSHSAFHTSVAEGATFDKTLERNIYYNHFDGFTARSNVGLEKTEEYFKKLGINQFINLVTSSDNYSPHVYPSPKAKDAAPFVKTWMLAQPTFSGLRLSLSERSRLYYGDKPDSWAECIRKVTCSSEKLDVDAELTPGLNVVIGGSSSGKSLFVDSLYWKIVGNIQSGNYSQTQYKVDQIEVANPAGQVPYYFPQNYIMKLCDKKDEEHSIDSNSILRRLFPGDQDERQTIENGLLALREKLALLIDASKEIQNLHEQLPRIPMLSHLIVTSVLHGNPLRPLLPNEAVVESISYGKAQFELDVKNLHAIDAFLERNPLIEHDKTLVEKLKLELSNAFGYSSLEERIREGIGRYHKEIDGAQVLANKEVSTKRQHFDLLLDCIRKYARYNRQFYSALDEISKFSITSRTKELDLAGHKLRIENAFELSREKFVQVVNEFMKSDFQIKDFNEIQPESFFVTVFSKRPKVASHEDFVEKVSTHFSGLNKKKFKITTREGKDFDQLSEGWKTSVILDLVLWWDGDNAPLVIDQPEDNLATGYINRGLLSAIKRCKSKRQIILVSHNATIPMLGDAQNVVMCRNDDGIIVIRANPLEGEIGGREVVDLVAETTDGGKISVKKRVKKYNLKSFRGADEADI